MPVPSPWSVRPGRDSRTPRRLPWIVAVLAAGLSLAAIGIGVAGAASQPLPPSARFRYGFVLDGQSPDGSRVREGFELLRRGVVDTLLVSGTAVGGGVHYSMVWVRMLPLTAALKGRVLEVRSGCTSTLDEARMMDAWFGERGVDSALVVTSGFHVWRAASIFDKVSQGRRRWFFHPAPDSRWDRGWTDREGLKSRFLEGTKRIAWMLLERWKPLDPAAPAPTPAIARGEELGRLPPPAWVSDPPSRP